MITCVQFPMHSFPCSVVMAPGTRRLGSAPLVMAGNPDHECLELKMTYSATDELQLAGDFYRSTSEYTFSGWCFGT